jgi:hypothetical protein
VKPLVEGSIKVSAHEVIAERRPDFGNTLDQELYPLLKTCQKFTGETEAKQEGGLSFTRLPSDTPPNFWQVITYWGGKLKGIVTGRIRANYIRKNLLYVLKSYFSAREKEKIRPKK